MNNRRDFLKNIALAGAGAAVAAGCSKAAAETESGRIRDTDLLVKNEGLPITGTFLDEVSHDIPHQNWGEAEWDQDFAYMKAMGIDTVINCCAGSRKQIMFPSKHLLSIGCYQPGKDLLDMFLRLAQKHGLKYRFGIYDSGKYWDTGDMTLEIDDNKYVIEEAYENYLSKYPDTFAGWYLCTELCRGNKTAVPAISTLGKMCKDISGGLPVFISPWIDGRKSVHAASGVIKKAQGVTVEEHEREWDEIFDGIHDVVDACAFQDGHVDIHELEDFLVVNKKLADKYGMECWTNSESFDRDMPIKFFPIKFDKMRLKLEAAKRAGYDKAITFEFSHFMSPQSAYRQAGHLYNRYCDYFGI